MKKLRFTKVGKYLIGGFVLTFLIGSIVFVELSLKNEADSEVDYEYVDDVVIDEVTPVVESSDTIIRPYLDKNIKIIKNYYNHQGTEEEQQNSILYYESTYMPNYAVAYGGVDEFEIVAILDGTVISIKDDSLLGIILEIKHENELISVYQSVKDVTVKENQVIKQGEVIGKGGISNINKNLGNHLLFEMIVKGQIVNPEEYYNKDINQL